MNNQKQIFKNFRFKKEFYPKLILQLICSILTLLFLTYTTIKLYTLLDSDHRIIYLFILTALIILSVACAANSLVFFYRTIIKTDRKLQEIDATSADTYYKSNCQTFESSLTGFLDYFNVSVQGEYTARLLQKQAELDYMQSQIDPHFLYNTLDSIRGQAIHDNSETTADMIESLSSMFRYSIGRHGDLISIEEELKNVENYVKIQKYRFNNRFETEIVLDSEDKNVTSRKIPKLTLQPIVENTFKHGLDSVSKNGKISIHIYTTQSRIIITVKDNGKGMDSTSLHELNTKFINNTHYVSHLSGSSKKPGIALCNVNSRIKMLFGEKYGLMAYSTEGVGTKIQITLPLDQAPKQ